MNEVTEAHKQLLKGKTPGEKAITPKLLKTVNIDNNILIRSRETLRLYLENVFFLLLNILETTFDNPQSFTILIKKYTSSTTILFKDSVK